MDGIVMKVHGDFNNTEKFLRGALSHSYVDILKQYGEEGVALLAEATPKRTGRTAASWNYEIKTDLKGLRLYFNNTNIQNGVNIALIIQLGHGTRRGGYVQGRDYINPVIRPLFDKMVSDLWREVNG